MLLVLTNTYFKTSPQFYLKEGWNDKHCNLTFLHFHTALCETHVRDALTYLERANFADDDWEQLGRELIKPSALKTIQANRPGEPDICLFDMVSWWLRSDGNATWDKLAEALKTYEGVKQGTINF